MKNKAPEHSIALCLIAKNEESMLGPCLESVDELVDEMVVVDTGSSDGTIRIAAEAGATVVSHPWNYDFSDARNEALRHTQCAWILVLDADERLAPGAARIIRKAVDEDQFDCAFLPLYDADELGAEPAKVLSGESRRGDPILLPRLFRNSEDLRWYGAVHETPAAWYERGQRSIQLQAPIIHLGNVPDIRERRNKNHRNLTLLQRQCHLRPDDSMALTYYARELLRAGRLELARDTALRAWEYARIAFSSPTEAKPAIVSTVTLHVFMLLDRQRPQAALNILDEAHTMGTTHPNLGLLRACALEQLGDEDSLREAIARIEDCLSQGGRIYSNDMLPGATSWASWNLMGIVRLRQGRFAEAVAAFDAAIRHRSPKPISHIGRSLALTGGRRAHDALAAIEDQLSPQRADGWIAAAIACLGLKNFTDARTFLERSDRAGRASLSYLDEVRRRAWAHTHAQDWLESLIEGDPPSIDQPVVTLVELGERRFDLGDLDGAIDLFLRALSQDSSLPQTWTNLGVAFHARGYCPEAMKAFHTALSLDPGHRDCRFNLGLFQVEQGRMAEAAHQFRQLLDEDEHHKEAREAMRAVGILGSPPPLALVVTTPGSSHLRTAVRAGLMLAGWHERDATPDILRALAPRRRRPEAIHRYLELSGPRILVLDPGARNADQWRRSAAKLDIPVALFPHGPDPAPDAAQPLLRLPQNTDAILRAFPSPPPAPMPPRTPPVPPLLSVLVNLGGDPKRHHGLLDRLSVQHLDPCFFEVVLRATPLQAEPLKAETRCFVLRRIDPELSLRAAVGECRASTIILLDDEGLPEMDTLRRHLVAQLASRSPTAIVGAHVYTPTDTLSTLLAERPSLAHDHASSGASRVLLFRDTNCSIPASVVERLPPPQSEDKAPNREHDVLDFAARLALADVAIERAPHIQVRHFRIPEVAELERWRSDRGGARFAIWSRHGGQSLLPIGDLSNTDGEGWLQARETSEMLMERARQNRPVLNALLSLPLPKDESNRLKLLNKAQSLIRTLLEAAEHHGLVREATEKVLLPFSASPPTEDDLVSIIVPVRDSLDSALGLVRRIRETGRGAIEVFLVCMNEDCDWEDMLPNDIHASMDCHNPLSVRIGAALERCAGDFALILEADTRIESGWREFCTREFMDWRDTMASSMGSSSPAWSAHAEPTGAIALRLDCVRALGGLNSSIKDDRLAVADLLLRGLLVGLRTRHTEKGRIHASPCDLVRSLSADSDYFLRRWKLDRTPSSWAELRTDAIRTDPEAVRELLVEGIKVSKDEYSAASRLLRCAVLEGGDRAG